jgi:hypothetical protein
MSSSTPSAASATQPPKGIWPTIAPYAVPPVAAAVAIVPVFRDLIAKSAQQKGLPVPSMTSVECMKEGIKAAPTVGAIVGVQMALQHMVEQALVGESKSLWSTVKSSAIVGTASAPVLAVFNGQTMGWTVAESLRKFSPRQGIAIACQETAFVGGLSAADRLAVVMRKKFGNNKVVDYTAAFIAGVLGSLVGHPGNTALTLWQSGLKVENPRQLMWGSARKARAIGVFSLGYKFVKDLLNSTVPTYKK